MILFSEVKWVVRMLVAGAFGAGRRSATPTQAAKEAEEFLARLEYELEHK